MPSTPIAYVTLPRVGFQTKAYIAAAVARAVAGPVGLSFRLGELAVSVPAAARDVEEKIADAVRTAYPKTFEARSAA